MTPGEMDRVIDAHLDAERRDDVEAILAPFGFEGGGRTVIYKLNHLFEFRSGLICRELGIADGASILHQLSQPA